MTNYDSNVINTTMGKENGVNILDTIPLGTATIDEHGKPILRSQKMFLDLIHSERLSGKLPGYLALDIRQGINSRYFAVAVHTQSLEEEEIVYKRAKKYRTALTQWSDDGLKEMSLNEFQRRYMNSKRDKHTIISFSGPHKHTLHSLHHSRPGANRSGRQK